MGSMNELKAGDNLNGIIKLSVTKDEAENGTVVTSPPQEIGGFIWITSVLFSGTGYIFKIACSGGDRCNLWSCKASFEMDMLLKSHTRSTGNHLFSPYEKVTLLYKSCDQTNFIDDPSFDFETTIQIHADFSYRIIQSTDFSENSKLWDVVLNVSGRRFHVNKSILAIHSSFFYLLFNSEFQEKNQTEIELKDLDPYEFEEFLGVIYPSTNAVTEENVSSMLKLADRFNVESVMRSCEDFLSSSEYCTKMESLKLAGDYKLSKVIWKCLERLNDDDLIKWFMKNKGFHALPSGVKAFFLEKLVKE